MDEKYILKDICSYWAKILLYYNNVRQYFLELNEEINTAFIFVYKIWSHSQQLLA